MSSCERCWREAGGDPDRYSELLKINECTPEEQAGGRDASICEGCGRKTIHLYTKKCTNPFCKEDSRN